MKKALAAVLTTSIAVSAVPMTAWAEEGAAAETATESNELETPEGTNQEKEEIPAVEEKEEEQAIPATPLEPATMVEEDRTLEETVEETTPAEEGVVKVGEATYKTIEDALKATEGNVEITLAGDLTEDVTIPEKRTVTLDLAGHTLTGKVKSAGKLTIQDSTAPSEPKVSSDYKTVTYNSGKIISEEYGSAVAAYNGGTVILESGMVESTRDMALFAQGDMEGTNAIPSMVEVKGGYVLAQEFAASAQGKGAVLNIKGGVLETKDNAVIAGNGSTKLGDTTINISGGTMIGNIESPEYIACGVYHPQAGKLNISGGTIYVHNGVGVLVRGGALNMTGGEIIATGTASGKVGDSNILAGGYGVQVDKAANYIGGQEELKAEIKGGSVAGEKGAVNLILDKNDPVESNKDKIAVSGGEFSSSVDPIFLDKELNYEAKAKDGTVTYHETLKDAQEAGGTVTQVKDADGKPVTPDTEMYEVTIKPNNGDNDTKLEVPKGSKINVDDLDTPVKSRYKFRGWAVEGKYVSGPIEAEKGMIIEAQWKKKSSSSGSSSSSSSTDKEYSIAIDKDIDNGKVKVDPSKAEKGDKVTITVTPDKGYEISKVVVKDADGEKLEVKDKGKGEYTFTMPDSKVEIDAKFVKAEEEKPEAPAEAKTIVLTIDQKIVNVSGEYVVNDVAPIIRNERTMLPIRFVAKELGAEVAWDDALNKVTITKDELKIELIIGSAIAVVNGENVTLDAPAFIENSRTYLPLRFVAENLGATVTWDAATQQVTIVAGK